MTQNQDPKSSPQGKNILCVADDWWGCAWYRCHVPGIELMRRGHRVVLDTVVPWSQLEACDIVVMQRQHSAESLEAMQWANDHGKFTVCDLDDNIWHVPRANPAHLAWEEPGVRERATAILRTAQLGTTPSRYLAEQMRKFNRNIKVLPNCLPLEHWDFEPEFRETGPVQIGWAGSASHWGDLEMFGPIINSFLDSYADAEFRIVGPDRVPFEPHERHRPTKGTTVEELPKLLRPFDIGVAPIVDNAFNRAKSDLKFLEYGMLGIPMIGSKLEPYMHTVKNAENGFLASNAKDWLKYLRMLAEDPGLRKRIGLAARAHAQTRAIDRRIHLWEKAYALGDAS